ncbi:hypothetical protein [Pseudoclavibacter sp. RFBB5]|uniref:hypothetical protein n=1 Tax=Pseudoclavibacter sp. RFBB5 TaxID=2080574 RepID=UPI000D4F2E69|nr:hypothetical protein [Pseudoclavibacter sp. RFBB5]PPG30529.1 hypothetical protein C5B97_06980 [Pseudoclavibacter sp. RFBB5]
MGLRVASDPTTGLSDVASARLASLGLHLSARADTQDNRALARVLECPSDARLRDASLREVIRQALADSSAPATVLVIPATDEVGGGPIAVLSPAESVTSYEVHLAAGLSAASGRPVEHLNARGQSGSATSSVAPARARSRSAASGWSERTSPDLDRALRSLPSRPSVIVYGIDPSSPTLPQAVLDHQDADQFLVLDRAHALLGAAVAAQLGAMVELAIGVRHSLAPATDAPPEREPKSQAPSVPAVQATSGQAHIRASDIIHASLTDQELVLTNRTALRVRLTAALGAASPPGTAAAQIAADLAPGESRHIDTESIPALAELAAPTAVMRNWSHSSSEVYEGGERRLLALSVGVLGDDEGIVRERGYDVPNGLDFAITASQLRILVGAEAARAVLPEPKRPPASAGWDVLEALEGALRVGASAMPNPGS